MSKNNNILKQMETINQFAARASQPYEENLYNDTRQLDKEEIEDINKSISNYNYYADEDTDTEYLAETQRDNILNAIKQFEQTLDNDHEVAMSLTSFGKSIILAVKKIDCCNPSLIYYHGFDEEGNRCMLIQHVSQINFLLIANKKKDPSKPPFRILGFRDSQDT